MPDENGYPTEKELKAFKKWKFKTGNVEAFHPCDVAEHLEQIWWAADWGFRLREGREHLFRRKVMKLELHTGGWSGNEDIIGELQETFFWFLYWVKSVRGGHYYFEIPWDAWIKVMAGVTNVVATTLHK